jgi:DNA polymerase-1
MYLVVASSSRGQPRTATGSASAVVQSVDAAGTPLDPPVAVPAGRFAETVDRLEKPGVRWVWGSTRDWYPGLLQSGRSVERCHDLELSRNILALSAFAPATPYVTGLRSRPVDLPDEAAPRALPPLRPAPDQFALFDEPQDPGVPVEDLVAEFAAQQDAVARSEQRHRLTLLLAAESAGALIAAEMEHSGMPWREDVHNEILTSSLGPRPREGERPAELEKTAVQLRHALGNPGLNPDSPQELLRALHRAGIEVRTTRSWELQQHDHAAIGPLLHYKKLSRLLTANGWSWLDAWVHDGRFRPEYVVGGVVSGRWASRGGGALQIPRQIRDASRPDPGHKFLVADAAQLEPRVLAALAQDSALARAARGRDLYQGIAEQGFGDRAQAKMAMLGAMYGATTGESGRLMPQLMRTYPRATGLVEEAARAGERGGRVSSRLGRSCPPPSERWRQAQQSTTAEEQRWADNAARSRGRFTRNFVVQATAAEWALCWLGDLRRRLRASQRAGMDAGELVFFLHDEVVLHVPDTFVDTALGLVNEAATTATELLFGRIPIDFPVNVAVVDSYADAK